MSNTVLAAMSGSRQQIRTDVVLPATLAGRIEACMSFDRRVSGETAALIRGEVARRLATVPHQAVEAMLAELPEVRLELDDDELTLPAVCQGAAAVKGSMLWLLASRALSGERLADFVADALARVAGRLA